MEIKQTIMLESTEPLSKALPQLDTAPAVIVTKSGKYLGVIDHRSVSQGIRNPHNTKCETAIVKPPVMLKSADVIERISAFLLGHFKALPVIDENEKPVGITTRVEALKEMRSEKLIPNGRVTDLMNSPVYTISENENVAALKKALKEKNARRMVVTRKGSSIGVVSDFDVGSWKNKSNLRGGRKDVQLSDKLDIDDIAIKSFIRTDITTVSESATIDDATKRMIEKEVSSVVVVAGKKPVGVLSALDIFKRVQDMTKEKTMITISGLRGDSRTQYNNIMDTIGKVIEKFRGSFDIKNVSIHTKEGKSVITVNIYFDTNEGHISLRGERATLKETVDELAEELDKVLRRKKDKRKTKGRASSYGSESGTRYL